MSAKGGGQRGLRRVCRDNTKGGGTRLEKGTVSPLGHRDEGDSPLGHRDEGEDDTFIQGTLGA